MKYLYVLVIIFLTGFLTKDIQVHASPQDTHSAENGAQFRKGKGLSLTNEMTQRIGLETTEVVKKKITPRIPITLRTKSGENEASGFLPAKEALKIRTGSKVEIPGGKGIVKNILKSDFLALNEYEVIVSTRVPLTSIGEIQGFILLQETEANMSIPQSALLKTVEGHFVYAKNGEFFIRTPVKIGAWSETLVEITDGLYSGDEVVTTPVMSLWMAELQVVRGGHTCTHGH